jgi:hypothetical protein
LELLDNRPARPKHVTDRLRAISSVSLKGVYFVGFYFVKLPGQNLTVIFMVSEPSLPHFQKPTKPILSKMNPVAPFRNSFVNYGTGGCI